MFMKFDRRHDDDNDAFIITLQDFDASDLTSPIS